MEFLSSNELSIIDKFTIKEGFQSFLPDSSYNVYSEIVDPNFDLSKNIQNEYTRLVQKGNVINPLYFSKKRNDAFMESETLRRNAYWRLIMVALFTFIICFALVILKNNFPFLPGFVFDLVFIVLFSSSILYILYQWISIQQRDPMNFNKLKLPAPDRGNVDILKNKTLVSGDLSLLTDMYNNNWGNACIGNACCSVGTYIAGNNRCEGFTSSGSFSNRFPESFTIYTR